MMRFHWLTMDKCRRSGCQHTRRQVRGHCPTYQVHTLYTSRPVCMECDAVCGTHVGDHEPARTNQRPQHYNIINHNTTIPSSSHVLSLAITLSAFLYEEATDNGDNTTTTTTVVLRPFVPGYLREPVPEKNTHPLTYPDHDPIFISLLWSPYVIGQTIIFSSCFFFFFFVLFFPRLISAVGDWMFTIHGVALVRI